MAQTESLRSLLDDISFEGLKVADSLRALKLEELGIDYMRRDEVLTDLTAVAAKVCDMPAALITLVGGAETAWIVASHNAIPPGPEPRKDAFCDVAIRTPGQPLIVEDATQDARFKDNWKVRDGLLSFYAGVPILADGVAIGALCVADAHPRTVTHDEIEGLTALTRVVSRLLTRGPAPD